MKSCWNCRHMKWYEEENHYECEVYGYGLACHKTIEKDKWEPLGGQNERQ
jgi:hypothetical protein